MNTIFTLATFVVAFFMAIYAYERGLKNGQRLSQGKDIQTMQSPVKTVIRAVEQHQQKKEEEKVTDELTDVMGASMDSMLQAVKKER